MKRGLNVLRFLPFYLISLFPFALLNGLARFFYLIIYRLLGYRKQVVKSNLSMAFPHKQADERKAIEKRFYRHFCLLFIQSLKVLTISKRQANKRVTFENLALLNDAFDRGENLILYSAHFGNWEWFAFMPLHIKHQFVSFYQEQSNAYFNALSVHMRERFGNICVESRTGYKRIMEMNRAGIKTINYMIGDQSPMAKSSMIWTRFLNQDTAFLVGASRIALKTGQPLIYPYVTQKRSGYYHIRFVLLEADDQQGMVESFATILEKNIQEQPELWLWTHRRWKIKKDS